VNIWDCSKLRLLHIRYIGYLTRNEIILIVDVEPREVIGAYFNRIHIYITMTFRARRLHS
jgi:hypothetical protein